MKLFRLFLGCPVLIWAFSFYGNQSHIQWRSVESDHFRMHYPVEYQDQAGKVLAFAEAMQDSVVKRYRIRLPGKSNLVLRNSLFSNGLANPVYNEMNVWLTDWDFRVRSTHFWMHDVVTHEFSHLVSIQAGAKLAPFIHGFQFSIQDFYNERSQENVSLLYPLTVYSLWLAEGTAQYESARMGFDHWDTHRDMLLRTAFLNDQVLPLEKMREFDDHGLRSELGPYNQGFSLVRYLSKKYGDHIVPRIWSELSRIHRMTLSGALKWVIGQSEEELYQEWKRVHQEQYEAVRDSLGTLTTGIKRTQGSFFQDWLRGAGDSLYGISNMGSDWFEGSLFAVSLRADSLWDAEGDSARVWHLGQHAFPALDTYKPWLDKGYSVRLLADSSLRFAYVTYRNRDRRGRPYFDIVVDDTLPGPWWGERPSVRHVTQFEDAVHPELSPDGQWVVFVRREANGTRFRLSLAPVPEPGEDPQEPQDLFALPDSMSFGGVYTPRWSPDGQWIAFSYFDGRYRRVARIDRQGQQFQLLSSLECDDRDPAWTADGKALIIASDRTGIFNLYRLALDSAGSTEPLTNVIGGAFAPEVRGSEIWYIGYDRDGFSVYQLERADTSHPQVRSWGKRTPWQEKALSIESLELAGAGRPYHPIPNMPVVIPMLSWEERAPDLGGITEGVGVLKGGFALGLTDPLNQNDVQLALLLELGKGWDFFHQDGVNPALQSDLMAIWQNQSFPWTMSLGYMRRNVAARDTVRNEDPRSAGDSLHLSHMATTSSLLEAAAGYSFLKKGDSLVINFGAQWAGFDLYEDGFAWDYYKNRHAGVTLLWNENGSSDGAGFDGSGARVGWQSSQAWLFRPGTFQESFTINSQGVISPKYRRATLHEAQGTAWWGLGVPGSSVKIILSGMASSIVEASTGQDTLDHFFHHMLAVRGYPYLADEENYLLHGTRTALGQTHCLIPLFTGWDASWWAVSVRDAYVDVYAQAGAAWWHDEDWLDYLKERQNWARSVGIEFRMGGRWFHQMPLFLSLDLARALDDISGVSLGRIDLPLLPRTIEPTRISFQLGFALSNGWSMQSQPWRP